MTKMKDIRYNISQIFGNGLVVHIGWDGAYVTSPIWLTEFKSSPSRSAPRDLIDRDMFKDDPSNLNTSGVVSQCFPLQVTCQPVELMAYAYLAVRPPSMSACFEELAAAAASKKDTIKKDFRFPELDEQAMQFISDAK
ncbi:hypothetical protein MLD38_029722 [Melastoma candidum]|uniref:Uncharacterized protein n=1 Tax=Melastoma candidum TaxID=119954 RepID=A0ACB9N4Y9_9MYRT|nr:hypothetical protein MLD38_029722 [Melastoma candidum]